jgi:hypothetical protein
LRDPGQWLGVEQQHAAGESLAQAELVVVEQPTQHGEALLNLAAVVAAGSHKANRHAARQ